MKQTDLAYIAGIMDGEGCICIVKRKSCSRKGYSYQLRVTIVNTNEWLVHSLKMQYNGWVYDHCSGTNKRVWEWRVDSNLALSFLESIVKYLKLKRAEAEIAINFQRTRPRWPTEWDYVHQEDQRMLLKKLKK